VTRRPLTRAQVRGQEIPEQERMDAYWSELCECGHGRHLHLNARGTGPCGVLGARSVSAPKFERKATR